MRSVLLYFSMALGAGLGGACSEGALPSTNDDAATRDIAVPPTDGGLTAVDAASGEAGDRFDAGAGRSYWDLGPPHCDDASTGADPNNCGSCGHSCVGGRCIGGVCQAVLLATGQQQPGSLTLDNQLLVWTTGESVVTCGSSGCAGQPEVLASVDEPQGLQITPLVGVAVAYWSYCDWSMAGSGSTATNKIVACPVGGCNGAPSTVVAFEGPCSQLPFVVDGQSVYFVDSSDALRSCPITGCPQGSRTIVALAPAQAPNTGSLVATGTGSLYWPTQAGAIYHLDTNAPSPSPSLLISDASGVWGMRALRSNYLEWLDAVNGETRAVGCQLPACVGGLQPLVEIDAVHVEQVLPDSGGMPGDSFAYWAVGQPSIGGHGSGAIFRCDRTSGCQTSELLYVDSADINSFLVSRDALYFAEDNGNVSKLALP